MDDLHAEIYESLPTFVDESNRSPLGTTPPGAMGSLPAAGDLGFRFLQQIVGSDQAKDIAALMKASEADIETYRGTIQSLQLTALQMRILGAIDEYKLANAPLKDLVSAFKTLKDKELVMSGKPTEIVGLAGYLQILDRDPELKEIQEAEFATVSDIPNL